MWTFRAEQLEKEVAVLKEKIHHLDDMLKSQQRKVRHMIEQVRRACARLCKASDLSSIFEQDSLTVCTLVAPSVAPERSHGDPGAGPRHQRAGGEGGFLGSGGKYCLLSFLIGKCFHGLLWNLDEVRVK